MMRRMSIILLCGCAVLLAEVPTTRAGDDLGKALVGMTQLTGIAVSLSIASSETTHKKKSSSALEREQEAFVAANRANLSRDAARGGGAYLSSLGELLGCSEAVGPALGRLTQRNFAALFPGGADDPAALLARLKARAAADAALASSCVAIA